MLSELIKSFSTKASWGELLINLLDIQYRILINRFEEYRKRIILAAILWTLGFAFINVSLMCMTLLILHVWWNEQPLLALTICSVAYGVLGWILVRHAWHHIT